MNSDGLDPAILSCSSFQARLIVPTGKVTAALALFERLKKDAAFAPKAASFFLARVLLPQGVTRFEKLFSLSAGEPRVASQADCPERAINHS